MAAAEMDANGFAQLGFHIRHFNGWQKQNKARQIELFRSIYGTSPSILAMIWQELRHTNVEAARLPTHAKPIHLLLVYRWMRGYETENELKTQFNMGVETIRNWCRTMAMKVANLRKTVVSDLFLFPSIDKDYF